MANIKIPVYKPYIPKNSMQYAHEALDSGWLSRGKYNELATERLKEILGVKYVLLTSNGTSATHLVARSLSFKHPEINYIAMPNNVYIAAWNSFIFDNNFYILPVAANIYTWNFSHQKLEEIISTNKHVAICAVHNVNHIVNVPMLKLKFPNTVIVEDACEGLFGKYRKMPGSFKYAGTEALVSSVSFFGNKNVTCGEGGALITNDEDIYNFAYKTHGQGLSNKGKFIHDILGYNYRMTNIQAAILYGQLEYYNEIMDKKAEIFNLYTDMLINRDRIILQGRDLHTEPSNWMFGVRIVDGNYDDIGKFFNENGIEVRPMFCSISKHNHLHRSHKDDIADLLREECVILPSYPDLSGNDIENIVSVLVRYLER